MSRNRRPETLARAVRVVRTATGNFFHASLGGARTFCGSRAVRETIPGTPSEIETFRALACERCAGAVNRALAYHDARLAYPEDHTRLAARETEAAEAEDAALRAWRRAGGYARRDEPEVAALSEKLDAARDARRQIEKETWNEFNAIRGEA